MFPVLAERRTIGGWLFERRRTADAGDWSGVDGRPKILLLDEPSLGLAPFLVQQIRDIIRQINAEGTAVLLVEQNASMALSVAQHGYIMETGHIVLDQPAAEMLADDQVKRFYLGLNEAGTKRDYSRFKDKAVREAEREAERQQYDPDFYLNVSSQPHSSGLAPALLQARNLTLRFKGVTALSGRIV